MTDKKITQLPVDTDLVDTDIFPEVETSTGITKSISWAYVKSILKTYFDTLYPAKNTAITGASKTKITYDSKGMVTSGTDATTADVSDTSNKRYCTDAQKTVIVNTSGTNSGNETAQSIGTVIAGATAKNTPVDNDSLALSDSNASNTVKKLTWAYVKSVLKTYFDTLYPAENTTTIGAVVAGATAKDTLVDADGFGVADSAAANLLKIFSWAKLKTGVSVLFKAMSSISTGNVSGAYAVDTYLAGSCITIPVAGGWQVGTTYRLQFSMVKTGAGTAAFTVTVRIGTGGDINDASVVALSFGAGTANADTGLFEVLVTFQTIGAGTSATIGVLIMCNHLLAATGLISTGTSSFGILPGTSAGFNSTTGNKIGVSINGGASFSGGCRVVSAELIGTSV